MITSLNLQPTTNRETWTLLLTLTDSDTGDLVDQDILDGLTFVCEIRRGPPRQVGFGVVPYYDVDQLSSGPCVTPTVTVVGEGVLQVQATAAQMRSMSADTYQVGLTATDGDEVVQVFLGRLPVIFGGVS